MSEDAKCVKCGKPGETKWTINGDGGFSIFWLCEKDSEPIRELITLADKKARPGARTRVKDIPPSPAPRKKTVKPLNWTPPN